MYHPTTTQLWHFVAPGVGREARLDTTGRSSSNITPRPAQVIFKESCNWNSWDKLVVPPKHRPNSAAVKEGFILQSPQMQPSMLEKMPAEVLAHIFFLLNPLAQIDAEAVDQDQEIMYQRSHRRDVLSLGLTCSTLWISCLWHIEYFRARIQKWAGTEITCLGNRFQTLPPAFIEAGYDPPDKENSSRIMREWHNSGMRDFNLDFWWLRRDENESPEVLWMRCLDSLFTTWQPKESNWRRKKSSKTVSKSRANETELEQKLREMLRSVSGNAFGLNATTSEQGGWRLRNLSKNVFVRVIPPTERNRKKIGAQISVSPSTRSQQWFKSAGRFTPRLDDALLLRICWDDSFDFRTRPPSWEKKGQWAGDKFDIIFDPEVEAGDGDNLEVWRDVTDEILLELIEWRSKLLGKQR